MSEGGGGGREREREREGGEKLERGSVVVVGEEGGGGVS